MREELKKIGNKERHRYSGTFAKYGYKYADRQRNHAKPTMILKNIKLIDSDNKEILVADHLWFNLTSGFKKLGILKVGEKVFFNGRVTNYHKGYYLDGISIDYKLERPTKIELDESLNHLSERKYFPDEDWKICNVIYDMYSEDYIKRDIPKPYLG